MITKINDVKVTNVQLKLNESQESVNETVQIGDTVRLDGEKGFVIGEIDGKVIIQIQGNTKYVDPKKVKEHSAKAKLTTKPHMKFDDNTLKLLFEQYVKCGVFMGNVPVKTRDCYVKYSSWEKANPEQQIKVLVEGSPVFIPKSQIQIFEDLNNFANEEDYVPGVIIDEETETVLENILLNVLDYTQALGDADPVRIVKGEGEAQELQTLPKSTLRTLAV